MSATDKLRRLLDERGVEWKATAKNRTVINGDWIVEEDVEATEYGDDTVFCAWTLTYHLTVEQAIDAVLGRGECEIEYVSDWMGWHCKSCDALWQGLKDQPPRFCKECGRQVKR